MSTNDTAVKDGKRVELGKYGCFDHPPFKDFLTVQTGWTEDGRRITREAPFVMSRDCKMAPGDPRCKGCIHLKGAATK